MGYRSNPLQFTLDNNGSARFTKWTENKIGVPDSEKAKSLPLWISNQENSTTINLDKEKDRVGKSIEVFVYPNKSNLDAETEEGHVEMTVTGTLSHTGNCGIWQVDLARE